MPDSPGSGRLAGLSVLIVEDETLLAIDYEAMLKRAGCVVMGPVPRESKALALLEGQRPDVVVLDLNLGGERPVALAEALVARGVPFLIVSGYGERQTPETIFRGAPRLDKPLKGRQLIDALATLADAAAENRT